MLFHLVHNHCSLFVHISAAFVSIVSWYIHQFLYGTINFLTVSMYLDCTLEQDTRDIC